MPRRTAARSLALALWCASPLAAHPEIEDALARLAAALLASPTDAKLYLARGELYAQHDDWPSAEANYLRAGEIEPLLPRLARAQGALALATDRLAEARSLLDRAVAAAPDDSTALVLRARTLARLGLVTGALADYSAAFALMAAPSPEFCLERAAAHRSPAEALRSLDEAIVRLGPVMSLQLRALELEIALGRAEAALVRLDHLTAKSERRELWLKRRGDVLVKFGRHADARLAYAAAQAALATLPAWLAHSPETARLAAELARLATTTP